MRRALIVGLLLASASLAGCNGSRDVYPLFPDEQVTGRSNAFIDGYRYENGIGVPRNYEFAVARYKIAAAKGDAKAMNNLGVMAMRGQGMSVSALTAKSYFTKAAQGGSASAHFNLGVIYDSGFGGWHNAKVAAEQYRIAAEMGHKDAQYRLSTMIESGAVISHEPGEARRMLDMAIASGDRQAIDRIGGLKGNKDINRFLSSEHCGECADAPEFAMVDRNLSSLKALAKDGDPSAQYNLAVRLMNGNAANLDPSEAARLFTLSARQGYAPAQRQLAQMHLRGHGVGRSKVLAHMWLNLAARNDGDEGRKALSEMEALEHSMTTSEIEEAQDLAASGANKGR